MPDFTENDILDRVRETEDERRDWVSRAREWETAYRLEPFTKNAKMVVVKIESLL
jgi:hypothetical protein